MSSAPDAQSGWRNRKRKVWRCIYGQGNIGRVDQIARRTGDGHRESPCRRRQTCRERQSARPGGVGWVEGPSDAARQARRRQADAAGEAIQRIYSDGARAAGSLSDAYSAGRSRKRVISRRVHSQADRGLTGDVARSTDNGNREHSDGRSGASAER